MKKIVTLLFFVTSYWIVEAQTNMDVYNGCPMVGEVSQSNSPERIRQLEGLNLLKNRYKIPQAEDFDNTVTLERMLGEPGTPDRNKFDVNKAATIEGYIVYAAESGSKETCNCKTTATYFTDQHLELALTANEPKDAKTIVVEITPRVRKMMLDQGIDWTHGEIKKYVGRKVRVSGWLFYDAEHEKDACSYHPEKCGDVSGYNRHTSWEIHPITSFEDITEELVLADMDENNLVNTTSVTHTVSLEQPSEIKPKQPMDYLILILLGGIVGMVGQLLRVIIGLKKAADSNLSPDYSRTTMSLVLAFAVGGVAGVLAAINTTETTLDKSTLMAFLASGYAGTDFIEGFISKNKPAVTPPLDN
jgi:hypothetical protein